MDAVTGSRILKLAAEAEPEEIYTAPYINQLYARDGRLYFTTTQGETLSEAGGLFSIDETGQDERLLSEECVQLHCVQDGYAYFEGVEEEREALCPGLRGGQRQRDPVYRGRLCLYSHRL